MSALLKPTFLGLYNIKVHFLKSEEHLFFLICKKCIYKGLKIEQGVQCLPIVFQSSTSQYLIIQIGQNWSKKFWKKNSEN